MRTVVALTVLLACSGSGEESLSEPLAAKEAVTVDIGSTLGPAERRAMGFLCGVWESDPAKADIAPLGITFARGDAWGPCPLRYDRLHAEGTGTFDRILSDDWNNTFYSTTAPNYGAPWPGDGGDWSKWDAFVKAQVSGFGAGATAIDWEVWNEPDGKNFWPFDAERFGVLWTHAVQAIRSVNKNARIVGPSFSSYHPGLMATFLDYASKHGVLPDIVSWHELNRDSPPNIKAHVDAFEKLASGYYGKHVPVHINEYVDNDNTKDAHQYSPGQTIWFIANLERAQVEHAGHSCWNEIGGGNNCLSGTLSGLLTHDGKRERRSTWYAYERYAKITGTLGEVVPSKNVDGVAGTATDGSVRILLGNHSDTDNVPVHLRVLGVAAAHVHVVVDAIHPSGPSASPGPVQVMNKDQAVTAGSVDVELDGVGKKGAWSVMLTPK